MSFEFLPPEERPEYRVVKREGLRIRVPAGWEARIRMYAPVDDEEVTRPVLHASTIPLHPRRADYGGGVVESLGWHDVFVSLVEFGDEAVGSRLFPEIDKIPRLEPEMFHPQQLQRRIRGQAGKQWFFKYRGRAFCLYVVLGSQAQRVPLTRRVNDLLEDLTIEPVLSEKRGLHGTVALRGSGDQGGTPSIDFTVLGPEGAPQK